MNLKFIFEYPHNLWSPVNVFKGYFDWFQSYYSDHNILFQNADFEIKRNPSGIHSPHIMTIRNLENKKYYIVSYWDRAIELTWSYNGWDPENMVGLITSAGVHSEMSFTPFSYVCYSREFEILAEQKRKNFQDKKNDRLLFRGYLYDQRKSMQEYKPEYFANFKVSPYEYFDELNDSRISLSLNGAGEVCNRDLEILCAGSVLLRPELSQKFHTQLIPNYHYVSVDRVLNPIEQFDLLIKKYEEIKDNSELLNTISRNGLDWFNQNGSIQGNVENLKKIIDIEKLK